MQTSNWDKTATPNYKSAHNKLTLPSHIPAREIGQEKSGKIHTSREENKAGNISDLVEEPFGERRGEEGSDTEE